MKDTDLYGNYTSTTMLRGFEEGELTAWTAKYFRHHLLAHLPADREAHILDVGCGYGRYIKAMMAIGYTNVTGIDISAEQIEYGRNRLGLAASIEVADPIPFLEAAKQSYQAILLLDVLEHLDVEYSISLLAQIRKSLSDDGLLIIQVPNGLSPLCVNRYGDVTHKRAYTVHSIEQSLKMAGYDSETIQHFPLGPFPADWKSMVRTMLWRRVISPLISLYLRIAVGGRMGGIYTENLLSTATRKRTVSV